MTLRRWEDAASGDVNSDVTRDVVSVKQALGLQGSEVLFEACIFVPSNSRRV